jgi:DNA-directed RNA polymerase specialized sigma24 family protein
MIQFRYHDELPIDKIADAIKSTPGTVRVALYRIRSALAQCIEDQLAKE